MYISRITLQNWKNFKDAQAELLPRLFIIGPNASGKSNFLDALRFLRDLAREGLKSAVEHRGGVSILRCLAARESPSIAIEVNIRDANDRDRWRYRVEFNQDKSRTPTLRREYVKDLLHDKVVLERPTSADKLDPLLMTQTSLEQIVANRDFRELADFFVSISYHHLVPQVVRDPKGFSPLPVKNDPYGRDLLLRIYNTPVNTQAAWLKRISKTLRQAVPQLQDLVIEMDSQGAPHLVGRFEHWRPHGAKQNEAQFSDGSLRLFGLLWSLFEGTGPLLLEEPELSLHSEVVRQIPDLFTRVQEEIRKMKKKGDFEPRQVIVSTHSEDLLRDESIGANEVLLIKPGPEGSVIRGPDRDDKAKLKAGLPVADVLLPKSAPGNGQLRFEFD